jgi:hypothetical protein
VIHGYNALQIGEVIIWMGIPQLAVIPLVPRLMKVVDARLIIAAGVLVVWRKHSVLPRISAWLSPGNSFICP